MNLSLKRIAALFFIGLVSGCSGNPFDFGSGEVGVFLEDDHMLVQNGLGDPIYYFAVESDTAALINWVPVSTEENKISSEQRRKILLEEVTGYEKGASIIFYYWRGEEPDFEAIESVLIETE